MKYDLLIRDGEVVDLGGGLRSRMDVGIAGGKIVEVASGLNEADARTTISAKDRLVTTTMSKLMHFGMTIDDVVLRATARPAKIAGLEGVVGSPRPGINADVAILEMRDGNFEFCDTDCNTVDGKRRLITDLTLKDGHVCYERPAE